MKHIIEFNLPEDQHDLNIVNKASNMHVALSEMSEYLKGLWKHSGKLEESIDVIRNRFHEILSDNEVNLN
jgi:hypothetical protein